MAAEKKHLFLRKRCRKERGQALAELMTILIAICFVLLGVILFSVVGVNGVKNAISARKEADHNMSEGIAKASGRQISYWANIGNGEGDSLQFTADDLSVSGNSASGTVYRDELVATDGSFDVNVLAANRKGEFFEYFDLAVSRLFFHAASLTSGSARISDVMSDPKLRDVRRALARFGIGAKIDIEDTVYMPDIYSEKKETGEK